MKYSLTRLNGEFCATWTEEGKRRRFRLDTNDPEEAKRRLVDFRPPSLYGRKFHTGFVYFFRCEAGNCPIKIGFTKNVVARRSGAQVNCPFPLTLLGIMGGTRSDERALHATFDSHRIVGEWFRAAPEIMKFIADKTEMPKVRSRETGGDAIDGILAQFAHSSRQST